jgi:uncharacterized protein YggE
MGKVLKGIIDDGTRKIPIENTFGQLICNIYIRPSDISIMDRYNEFKKDFSSILDPLKNLNIDRNGEPDFDADWAVLKEVEAELKKRIIHTAGQKALEKANSYAESVGGKVGKVLSVSENGSNHFYGTTVLGARKAMAFDGAEGVSLSSVADSVEISATIHLVTELLQ